MRAPLLADIEDLTGGFLLQIKRIIHECSSCCRYRGSYMSAPIVADIEDLKYVHLLLQI